MTLRFAFVSVSLLALAACGSNQPADEAPAATESGAPEVTTTSDAMASEAPTANETPTAQSSGTPAPTPSPSAAAAPAATPAPAKVAAADPPEAFKQCSVCHSTEPGKTLIGPSLAGIYGEKAGAVPGYKFSDAMKDSGITWNDATLDSYLTDPKKVVPGTNMSLAGIKDPAKRADIIAYLKTL